MGKPNIYLYKYRPDDIYTIKLLCEQRLHFSHPNEFNDPLDCRPPSVKLDVQKVISDYARGKGKIIQDFIHQNKSVLQNIVFTEKHKQELYQDAVETFNSMNILCLSLYNNSPIMWAHYAMNHSGICMAFDVGKGGNYIHDSLCRIVEYVDTQEPIDLDKPNDIYNKVECTLFQKFKGWEYEGEFRIVKTPEQMVINGELQNQFEKSALVAMFFGLYMKEERQEFYKLLCKQCGLDNVKFFKMTLPTDGTYILVPKEI